MKPSFKVVETFYSIQGEGKYSGHAAFFIRLFGCNLKCNFGNGLVCDDKAHSNKDLIIEKSYDTLLDEVASSKTKLVILTGGEVSLHNMNPFIKRLQSELGVKVAIESNGTNLKNIDAADHIVYAPKDMFCSSAPVLKSGFHELRVLANANHPVDVERWASVKEKYVSPINYEHALNMDSVNYCIEFVKSNPTWKLSLQTHKVMGIR